MITVHLVANAHLDPIWLWPWTTGVDAALATCASACDRLDAHPDLHFSRGEAWVYSLVEQLDPALFARIRAHVETGRWEIVGGWWIQPDCNAPTGDGLRHQIALGLDYFEQKFRTRPTTAYNVDSFGHAATLPGLMREAGQTSYVFMRPGRDEKALPARLFRWRGYVDGPEVLAYRLPFYCTGALWPGAIDEAVADLPRGVDQAMLFYGVGDHGGGPTEQQIAWLREQQATRTDVRLEFSTVQAFFEAVAPYYENLDLVVGELQHHAIGCYSVHRECKGELRRADQRLRQLEAAMPQHTGLEEAWQTVCFHQFHDTLGGTCLPSAYQAVVDQLRGVSGWAERELALEARRRTARLAPDSEQRLCLWNAADLTWRGLCEHEVWVEGGWQADWHFVDENGRVVPYQNVESEALLPASTCARVLLLAELAPRSSTIYRLRRGRPAPPAELKSPQAQLDLTASTFGWHGDQIRRLPDLELVPDDSDTWSHGIDRYSGTGVHPEWQAAVELEAGPVRWAWQQRGRVGSSQVTAEWRSYADLPWLDLELTVEWHERHQLLRLCLSACSRYKARVDGIPGGALERALDGAERPLHDWTRLCDDSAVLGVVAPTVYALSATPSTARFTLLRSPWLAHHEPYQGEPAHGVVADQGRQHFTIRFMPGAEATPERLRDMATALQQPPLIVSVTRGMPAWPQEPKF